MTDTLINSEEGEAFDLVPCPSSDELITLTDLENRGNGNEDQGCSDVVGIRFQRAGRVYYFDPAGIELDIDDRVVVETIRGPELGWVVIAPKQVIAKQLKEPLKPVLRKAAPEELQKKEDLQDKERDALVKCQEKVAQFNLPMKIISAEHNFDSSRLTFYFSAEGRVDFRDLVRELASMFHTRVELRQIGERDAAKLLGGMGRCGRLLCCHSHICEFNTVSIKMAKEQDLPLNPMKISGLCGRLLCCLAYENECYCKMKEHMPATGQNVSTAVGPGRVVSVNILKETVIVQLESGATTELPAAELQYEQHGSASSKRRRKNHRKNRSQVT